MSLHPAERSERIGRAARAVMEAVEQRVFLSANLPDKFEETIWTSGLLAPTSMDVASDGRIFVAEKGMVLEGGTYVPGTIRVINADGTVRGTPALTLQVDVAKDRGISGVKLHPNFESNGYIYVHYNTWDAAKPNDPNNASKARLSRFTVTGNTIDPASELVIVREVSSETGFHPGGMIEFDNDGYLYVGFGVPDGKPYGQDLTNLAGKLLRLHDDGTIPEDNPYHNHPGKNEIWAYGFRNPFNGDYDPVTDTLYVNDAGEHAWEEINILKRAANYGWSIAEGPSDNPAVEDPIFAYDHSVHPKNEGVITGGLLYRGNAFPDRWTGRYFFADYDQTYLRWLDPQTGENGVFGTGLFRPVDLELAPDGNIYYVSVWGGEIRKISYVGNANRAPTAVASASKTSGLKNFTVSFSGNGSTDPDNDSLTYTWDFDNGDTATGKNVDYTFKSNGVYDVVLTVTDEHGKSNTAAPIRITVGNEAPKGVITAPGSIKYTGGQTIEFSGTATDNQDDRIPASQYFWTISFFHGSDAQGTPILFEGIKRGSFEIPTDGLRDPNQMYRISLTVSDSGGLTHTSFVDIKPRKSTITVDTNITGLQVGIDGLLFNKRTAILSPVGLRRPLVAPPVQTLNGKTYEFAYWSDGGKRVHDISVSADDTTYVAYYRQITLPGVIQAENFNDGANNVAYKDTTAHNEGGAYRETGVDVGEYAGASNGHYLGWTHADEWFAYRLKTEQSGTYDLQVRLASPYAGGKFHIEIDGKNVSGTLDMPNTGSWESYQTLTIPGVKLTAGQQTLRVVMDANNTNGSVGNFDYFRAVFPSGNQSPSVILAGLLEDDVFKAGSNLKLNANPKDADGSIVKVEFFADGQKIGTSTDAPWTFNWKDVKAGTYTVIAKATDNDGAVMTSPPIHVRFLKSGASNRKPGVKLVNPDDGDKFTAGKNVKLNANPTDPDGKITKVRFFANGERIGTETDEPYVMKWKNLKKGTYKLKAKAWDNDGEVAVSKIVEIKVVKAAKKKSASAKVAQDEAPASPFATMPILPGVQTLFAADDSQDPLPRVEDMV